MYRGPNQHPFENETLELRNKEAFRKENCTTRKQELRDRSRDTYQELIGVRLLLHNMLNPTIPDEVAVKMIPRQRWQSIVEIFALRHVSQSGIFRFHLSALSHISRAVSPLYPSAFFSYTKRQTHPQPSLGVLDLELGRIESASDRSLPPTLCTHIRPPVLLLFVSRACALKMKGISTSLSLEFGTGLHSRFCRHDVHSGRSKAPTMCSHCSGLFPPDSATMYLLYFGLLGAGPISVYIPVRLCTRRKLVIVNRPLIDGRDLLLSCQPPRLQSHQAG